MPRQATNGGKPRLLGISTLGSRSLHPSLIHSARAVLPVVLAQGSQLGHWARGVSGRAHKTVVIAALAANPARIVCAVLRRELPDDPTVAAA